MEILPVLEKLILCHNNIKTLDHWFYKVIAYLLIGLPP